MRNKAVVAIMTLLIASVGVVVGTVPADAHGALTFPASRSYMCVLDGDHPTGDIVPNNPACSAAIDLGGKQPLFDWFGVLRSDGAGRTKGFIPDGQLCGGGNPTFDGLNLARADWPYTSLTSGAEWLFRYNAWAPHPGEFRLYITKEGYDPNEPLGWDDLESTPFSTYSQQAPNGDDPDNNTPDYQWRDQLPSRTGRHIIYSVWERSDSQETFYGCSDVVFDGGRGEIFGVGDGGPIVEPPSPPPGHGDHDHDSTTTTAPPAPTTTTTYPTTTTAAPTTTAPNPGAADGYGDGYWSTRGADLIDGSGNEVTIRGVNWFGFETSARMPHGLWSRNWASMIDQIAELKFNTLRLPFSSALLEPGTRPNGINAAENADVANLTSLELMDRIIDYAGQKGIKVILDRHALGPVNRHHLWYDDRYSEQRFIEDWELLATRYRGNETVIGADIYNEPHDEACWGCGDVARDWKLAAEAAGNAIHGINPGWLIFVEGVEQVDGANCDAGRDDCIWWGGNLADAGAEPIVLNQSNKVVYSPHEYATSVYRQPWFDSPDFPSNLPGIWDRYWGYLEKNDTAPIMVGEFGTKLDAEVDRIWLRDLMAYLDNVGAGFTFWTFNPNSGDTGGILNDDWRTVNQDRYQFLAPYLIGPFDGTATPPDPDPDPTPTTAPPTTAPPTTVPPTTGPTPTTAPPTTGPTPTTAPPTTTPPTSAPNPDPGPPTGGACEAEVSVKAVWPGGYLALVTVTNTDASALDGWTISWRFNDGESINSAWGLEVGSEPNGETMGDSLSWNGSLAPGEIGNAGFVATMSGTASTPPGNVGCTASGS